MRHRRAGELADISLVGYGCDGKETGICLYCLVWTKGGVDRLMDERDPRLAMNTHNCDDYNE